MFLVGAFLQKKVDYSHGFLSVFFHIFNFFRYTGSDQITCTPKVLRKLKKTPNCTPSPKELNQKGFPRNIQYRTIPKSSVFFSTFPGKFFSRSVLPSIFWSFATEWMLRNPKGSHSSPVQFFSTL